MLVSVAAASALGLFWPAITKGAAGGVEPSEAVLLMNREKAVVIDVCEPAEFAQGHVCLLYTSPSPRDYAASRMPSSA